MQIAPKLQRAFLAHYDHCYGRVYRYLRMRSSHDDDAKDLTSEVFLRAIERLAQYDEAKGNFEQWLLGIAKYRLIDYWRAHKDVFTDDGMLERVAGDVNEGFVQSIDLDAILATLPDADRVLVTFHYVDGYSYEEIALMLDTTAAAARQRASRILRRLQLEHTSYEKTS